MLSKNILRVSSLVRGSRAFRTSIRVASCKTGGLPKCPGCKQTQGPIQTQLVREATSSTMAAAQHIPDVTINSAKTNDENKMLEVTLNDGSRLLYPYVWLRDNCQCPECWHPTTRSRLLRMKQLDPNVKPVNMQFTEDNVSISWSDGHQSVYDATWLNERQFTEKGIAKRLKRNWIQPKYWGSELQEKVPSVDFNQFMTDDYALHDWLCSMEETGLHFIKGAHGENDLRQIASRVAFLRNHNYGEVFQVMSKPDPNNLAFTNATLGLHTDNPYYYYVPGVQMLHCLKQSGTEGGDNVFADGFNAAYQMKEEQPEHFETLSQLPVDFYDVGKEGNYDYFLRTRKPTVNIDDDGQIYQINYNHQVRDTELNLPVEKVTAFYQAMKAYDELLYHPRNAVQYKLKPGEVACFHNYRVLHGRLGYKMTEGGERWLNGGFLDWDEMHSMRRVLQTRLGL